MKHSSTEVFPHGIFWQSETKNVRWKNLEPPFSTINLFAAAKFLKHSKEGFPYERVRHCETKVFGRKILIPLSYPYSFSIPEVFSNTTQKDSVSKISGTLRQKTFDGKTCYPPPSSIIFYNTGVFMKHSSTEVFTYGIFWQSETKNIRWKILKPPPLLNHKPLRCRKISETQHRRVPLRKSSAL